MNKKERAKMLILMAKDTLRESKTDLSMTMTLKDLKLKSGNHNNSLGLKANAYPLYIKNGEHALSNAKRCFRSKSYDEAIEHAGRAIKVLAKIYEHMEKLKQWKEEGYDISELEEMLK